MFSKVVGSGEVKWGWGHIYYYLLVSSLAGLDYMIIIISSFSEMAGLEEVGWVHYLCFTFYKYNYHYNFSDNT